VPDAIPIAKAAWSKIAAMVMKKWSGRCASELFGSNFSGFRGLVLAHELR
jgi:hypothetical protein